MVSRANHSFAGEISALSKEELVGALAKAEAGTVIKLMPGEYKGGIFIREVKGEEGLPVIISGNDKENPPVFIGGGREAMHLTDCEYIVLKDITIREYPENGINIDDGATPETPAKHIMLENVTIENIGPTGNSDALKLSGVEHFFVKNCTFKGWGGSAIDMVGCHNGVIDNCDFLGIKEYSQNTGIQMKGNSTNIFVKNSFFKDAGQRAINIGGVTGLEFFRPYVAGFEAKDITIAGNRFVGSEAAIAWVTANGGHVYHNTFLFPEKWVLRILQETEDTNFEPCHGGIFEKNLIVFDKRVKVFVNVGANTNPKSFKFSNNAWYQVDGFRKPSLPVREEKGVYWVNPKLQDMKIISKDPRFSDIGADVYIEKD